jgi:hypothetical protein
VPNSPGPVRVRGPLQREGLGHQHPQSAVVHQAGELLEAVGVRLDQHPGGPHVPLGGGGDGVGRGDDGTQTSRLGLGTSSDAPGPSPPTRSSTRSTGSSTRSKTSAR